MQISRRALFLIVVSALYLLGMCLAWYHGVLNVYCTSAQIAYVFVLGTPFMCKRFARFLHMR